MTTPTTSRMKTTPAQTSETEKSEIEAAESDTELEAGAN